MKILLIGGTGTISRAVTKQLIDEQNDVYLLNRGNNNTVFANARQIIADIHDEQAVMAKIKDMSFDVVADFIAFTKDDVMRDYRLFSGRCSQYIFISSASAYQKPPKSHIITEKTPLENPFWEYSRNKIECEKYLFEQYEQNGFPVTVVRPSHTYCEKSIPVAVHGDFGSWQVIQRMISGKPVVIPGDGESLWTLTYNTDFAPLFCAITGNKNALGEAYQITSDEALTWNRIYEIIAVTLGVKLNAVHILSRDIVNMGKKYGYDFEGGLIGDKTNSAVFDNAKIKQFLPEYKTKTPFESGVKIALDYILSHKECQKTDEKFDKFCDDICKKYE